MKVLHILRKRGDSFPNAVIAAQTAAGDQVSVLNIQDAVLSCNGGSCCKEDADARGVSCGTQVDYGQMVNMIFEADSVVNW